MVSSLLIKLIIISKIFASNIVNYKFGSNFGQIFYDYSGSGNHGVNGDIILTDPYDTIPTDRGAYFPEYSNHIKLPPNSRVANSVSLGSQFSIIMWFNCRETNNDYYIFYRYKNDNSRCLELKRTYTPYNSFSTRLCQYSNTVFSSSYNILKFGKNYIDSWTFFVIISNSSNMNYYINGVQKLSLSLPNIYSDSGTYIIFHNLRLHDLCFEII